MGVLERVLPLAGRLVGGVRLFALVTLVAALLIWSRAVADAGFSADTAPVLVLALLLLAGPAGVLFFLSLTLREVLQLPQRIRRLPEVGREHAGELAGLAATARRRERLGITGLFGGLWKLGRLLVSGRDALLVHAPLVTLARPALLVLLPAAFVLAVVEVAVAVIILLTQAL